MLKEGDTVASALLRNEIRLIGRSFKYHRPKRNLYMWNRRTKCFSSNFKRT